MHLSIEMYVTARMLFSTNECYSPPAGRKRPFFLTKIWLGEPNFCQKDMKYYIATGEVDVQVYHPAGIGCTA